MNLTAYSQDTEPRRIERLNRIKTVMELYPDRAGPVDGLHDHKGMLTVFYSETPEEEHLYFARDLWSTLEFEPLIEFKPSESFWGADKRKKFFVVDGGKL